MNPVPQSRRRWKALALVVMVPAAIWAYSSISKSVVPYFTSRDHMTAFEEAIGNDDDVAHAAIDKIRADWQPQDEVYVLQSLQFVKCFGIREKLFGLLPEFTDQKFGADYQAWMKWYWQKYSAPPPNYASNIRRLYARAHVYINNLGDYFSETYKSEIRLDEIVWGGVGRRGVIPIDSPYFVKASESKGMGAKDVVFGLTWKGHHRAYPKRILANHEFLHDEIAGDKIELVYCPLCEVVIPYLALNKGTTYRLDTSGLLYRSSKLMYDEGTLSLWSTIEGRPVMGPLCGQGIQLEKLETSITTWKQWTEAHPDTLTLSLDRWQGSHQLDDTDNWRMMYMEGNAYSEYYSSDKTMFAVSSDQTLDPKSIVYSLQRPGISPTYFTPDFIRRNPCTLHESGDKRTLILHGPDGGLRAYDSGIHTFKTGGQASELLDERGEVWKIEEQAIQCAGPGRGEQLTRVPVLRMFWFAVDRHDQMKLLR